MQIESFGGTSAGLNSMETQALTFINDKCKVDVESTTGIFVITLNAVAVMINCLFAVLLNIHRRGCAIYI